MLVLLGCSDSKRHIFDVYTEYHELDAMDANGLGRKYSLGEYTLC